VIGATNRPFDVDPAFLRRMPRSFFVGLPNDVARAKILTSMLNNVPKDSTFDMRQIIQATEFYTPSDIKEVLRTAALFPLREARGEILRRRQQGELLSRVECMAPKLRPLRTTDVIAALHKVSPTPLSEEYKSALLGFASKASGRSMSPPTPHFPNQNNFQNGMNPYSHQNFGQHGQNHGQYQVGNQNDYYVTNNVSPPSFDQMQGNWESPHNFDEYDSYDESYDDSTYFFAGKLFAFIIPNYQQVDDGKLNIHGVIAGVISGVIMLFIEMILFVIRNHEMDKFVTKKMKTKKNPFGYDKKTAQRTFQG